MKIISSNPLFLLTKLSSKTRIFITASAIACYGLFLYELLPEYLFNSSMSLYYFVFPIIVIAGILIVIPKFMTKGKIQTNQSIKNAEQEGQSQQPIEDVSFSAPKQEQGMIMTNNNSGGIISDIVLPSPDSPQNEMSPVYAQQPAVNENTLNDLVTRAVEPFQKDISRMQDTITDVRAEINSIRTNIQDLTLTFETSLTDLKAFQAEIANPLNFMRKYFDSMDIKALSDPTFPLHADQTLSYPGNNSNQESPHNEADQLLEVNHNFISNDNQSTTIPIQNDEPIRQEIPESHPFKQLFNGSLTLGKLMTTTTVLEEILQTVDRNSIDILIEQCKLMGLKQEDEHVIYNIINMMDQSGLSVKEILLMLYKFGKVMGLADKEADLVYAKLMMSQGKPHGTIMTVESKGN